MRYLLLARRSPTTIQTQIAGEKILAPKTINSFCLRQTRGSSRFWWLEDQGWNRPAWSAWSPAESNPAFGLRLWELSENYTAGGRCMLKLPSPVHPGWPVRVHVPEISPVAALRDPRNASTLFRTPGNSVEAFREKFPVTMPFEFPVALNVAVSLACEKHDSLPKLKLVTFTAVPLLCVRLMESEKATVPSGLFSAPIHGLLIPRAGARAPTCAEHPQYRF